MRNKEDMYDKMNRMRTASLFLEIAYNKDALFTLKDDDVEYEGKTYTSLKKLYLEHEDIVEYGFATTYLIGWQHWKKMCGNKALLKHIEEWREELELRLRSQGLAGMLDSAADGNFQANKLLLDRGWEKRGAGRPSKEEQLKETRIQEKLQDEFSADIIRLTGK